MSNTKKASAMGRIHALLDENSFVEIGALVTKRNTDFNMQDKAVPSDGVITGYGVIDGNPVYVYSQDADALGGTIGEMHAGKISHIYDLALGTKAPVIALVDCAGFRLQEGCDALAGFGELYRKQMLATGVIPQICAIFGTCGGGSAISSHLSDFTCMPLETAELFVLSPDTLDGNYKGKCDTSSARFQAEAGNVDFLCRDEAEVLEKIRLLIGTIPTGNEDNECTDDLNRLCENFESILKDPAAALPELSDSGFFLEVKKEYAKEMVTGFIRLNGMTVGAIANRLELGETAVKFDGTLTTEGCRKAEKFMVICDAYRIPVVTLTNVAGFQANHDEEKTIGQAVAGLTYAFANATVPKVNVITGKAYGSAYITMNSRHIGADLVFAFPFAEIGLMEAASAVKIIYAEELKTEADSQSFLKQKAAEYDTLQSGVQSCAERGYIDSIIEPESIRKHLIYAFEMLFTKSGDWPSRKHGTV